MMVSVVSVSLWLYICTISLFQISNAIITFMVRTELVIELYHSLLHL